MNQVESWQNLNSKDDHGKDKDDEVEDGDDPTKCLDWPCSNPHTPKTSSDNEVLTLQSLVPKIHFPLGQAGDEEDEVVSNGHVRDPDRLQTLPGGAGR